MSTHFKSHSVSELALNLFLSNLYRYFYEHTGPVQFREGGGGGEHRRVWHVLPESALALKTSLSGEGGGGGGRTRALVILFRAPNLF